MAISRGNLLDTYYGNALLLMECPTLQKRNTEKKGKETIEERKDTKRYMKKTLVDLVGCVRIKDKAFPQITHEVNGRRHTESHSLVVSTFTFSEPVAPNLWENGRAPWEPVRLVRLFSVCYRSFF